MGACFRLPERDSRLRDWKRRRGSSFARRQLRDRAAEAAGAVRFHQQPGSHRAAAVLRQSQDLYTASFGCTNLPLVMFAFMWMRQDTSERHGGKFLRRLAGVGGLNFVALLPFWTNESIPGNCRRRVQLSTVLLRDHLEGLRSVLHKYLIVPSSREYWTRLWPRCVVDQGTHYSSEDWIVASELCPPSVRRHCCHQAVGERPGGLQYSGLEYLNDMVV